MHAQDFMHSFLSLWSKVILITLNSALGVLFVNISLIERLDDHQIAISCGFIFPV